jgi:hypothetical protein
MGQVLVWVSPQHDLQEARKNDSQARHFRLDLLSVGPVAAK